MDLIDIYCNVVVRFLKDKEKIKKEVRVIILNKLEEKYGYKENYREDEVNAILKEMGDPNLLAIKYSRLPKSLIGENIAHFYYALAIGLLIVWIGSFIGLVVSIIASPKDFIGNFFAYFGKLIFFSVFILGLLVIIYTIIELTNKKLEPIKYHPSTLKKEKPKRKLDYRKSDSILGIIFITLVFIFLNFHPGLLAIYSNKTIPILNIEYLHSVIWIGNFIFIVEIILNIYKLVSCKKTLTKAICFYSFALVSSIVLLIIFINPDFINIDAITFFRQYSGFNNLYEKYGILLQQRFFIVLIVIGVIGHTVDFFISLYHIFIGSKDN